MHPVPEPDLTIMNQHVNRLSCWASAPKLRWLPLACDPHP
jgi:hypothetical protein